MDYSAVTSGDNRSSRGYQKASKLEASPEKRQPFPFIGTRAPIKDGFNGAGVYAGIYGVFFTI
jgi:hypothetical protein